MHVFQLYIMSSYKKGKKKYIEKGEPERKSEANRKTEGGNMSWRGSYSSVYLCFKNPYFVIYSILSASLMSIQINVTFPSMRQMYKMLFQGDE